MIRSIRRVAIVFLGVVTADATALSAKAQTVGESVFVMTNAAA
jgi:hypothetical protein